VDKDGKVVDRYAPTTSPLSIEVRSGSAIHSPISSYYI
jgi:glutathione peroxidase-family protein